LAARRTRIRRTGIAIVTRAAAAAATIVTADLSVAAGRTDPARRWIHLGTLIAHVVATVAKTKTLRIALTCGVRIEISTPILTGINGRGHTLIILTGLVADTLAAQTAAAIRATLLAHTRWRAQRNTLSVLAHRFVETGATRTTAAIIATLFVGA
jgi:hypothetical protein